MHFTLWPSPLSSPEGHHAEVTWQDFLGFVAAPQIAPTKNALEGWSPVRFQGNHRSLANVDAVSCIGLDDDSSGLSLERLVEIWGPFAGAIHSTYSHTDAAPKWRIVLQCSRDLSAEEQRRVWLWVAARAASSGQHLDGATKDASRFWYVPGHAEGAPYAWRELTGQALDVDMVLVSAPPEAPPSVQPNAMSVSSGRRTSMALALGAAWPAKGRHEAQLALAGALRAEGWPEADALEFLCDVCRVAGDEDRPKREKTIAHTYGRPADARLTGWTRLKASVDPVVVDAVRGALGKSAEFAEQIARRTAELKAGAPQREEAGLGFEYGCWEKEPPPTKFLVDNILPQGCVGMIFGRADALKTWLLFSLGLAVAAGKPWLGKYAVSRATKVGIVDFETGQANVDRRLFMLRAGNMQNLGRKSFAKLKPNDPEFWLALASEGFELVIIDSLRKANPGANENESGEAIRPLELAAEFSEATGCAVLFIHHAKKDSTDGWPDFRGSGAIEDQVDVSFAVKKTDISAESKLVEVRCEKPGDMRTPDPFNVEVSFDDIARTTTLHHAAPKPPEKESEEPNEQILARVLRAHPAGAPKADVLNLLKGENKVRRAVVSTQLLAGTIVEFKTGKTIYLMRNPSLGV